MLRQLLTTVLQCMTKYKKQDICSRRTNLHLSNSCQIRNLIYVPLVPAVLYHSRLHGLVNRNVSAQFQELISSQENEVDKLSV